MTNINPVYINPMLLDAQQEADFEQILAEQSGQIETEASQEGDEVIYTDDDIADMIIANGVITESIRQMRENEQKLKEILDEV
ncbi:VPA1340 family putative T3SS effector [Vibrio cholerae]|uniref:VPA1340 family putative T3SS effector n=1 Tax=Vibrio cholerae TaxID=666 RepID=UPI00226ED4C7|nr:VPA1340 family putative T3SS effector [Vibrio cholerae]EHD7118187.1 VPA1340 family putative T3SS effector [Vibrio cholerae]EJL6942752.1 VPA1340 family putative T3SS effector [Vibrio cholerae]EKF9183046.1 VPA1340 family putative T3SS effector [Vibrio cholerae]EKF9187434.1 VPA1340 family putative T3SS effector [Vibrio cholerae]EKF9394671.1 VPA1340 family putative T3SS effector [Vibrio cholerae]